MSPKSLLYFFFPKLTQHVGILSLAFLVCLFLCLADRRRRSCARPARGANDDLNLTRTRTIDTYSAARLGRYPGAQNEKTSSAKKPLFGWRLFGSGSGSKRQREVPGVVSDVERRQQQQQPENFSYLPHRHEASIGVPEVPSPVYCGSEHDRGGQCSVRFEPVRFSSSCR